MTFYIVHPDRAARRPHANPSSKWHPATDLPGPAFWRYLRSGQEIPEPDRLVVPGETIELCMTEQISVNYYGIELPSTSLAVLRRARLEESGTYTELFQSTRYKEMIAHGELRPFGACRVRLALPGGDEIVPVGLALHLRAYYPSARLLQSGHPVLYEIEPLNGYGWSTLDVEAFDALQAEHLVATWETVEETDAVLAGRRRA